MTAEEQRLEESRDRRVHWKRWGPYLSERAWGTVREDYSAYGTAWDYFPHDHARSRAYRWNEDGLAGICDRHQQHLLRPRAVERARSDPEGAAVRPDRQRRQSRRGRQGVLLLPRQHADALLHAVSLQVSAGGVSVRAAGRREPAPRQATRREFELIDTGVFDDDRYFDVVRRVRQGRRRRHPDPDHGRPTRPGAGAASRAADASGSATPGRGATRSRGRDAATRRRPARRSSTIELSTTLRQPLAALRRRAGAALHRERNEHRAAVRRRRTARRYVKDGINDYVVHGARDAVNPAQTGTKAAAHYTLDGRRRARRRPSACA